MFWKDFPGGKLQSDLHRGKPGDREVVQEVPNVIIQAKDHDGLIKSEAVEIRKLGLILEKYPKWNQQNIFAKKSFWLCLCGERVRVTQLIMPCF